MQEHNHMPKDGILITKYEDWQDYFTFAKTEEFRQPFYNPATFNDGLFCLNIYWINKDLGLGYGVANDWKAGEVKFYKFGTIENWHKFRIAFAAKFAGDKS